jgi:hypothetical protein
MAAVQVINTASNVAWTTDKVEFATTLSNVTFQVSVQQLTYVLANGATANGSMSTTVGNIYANAIQIPGNTVQQYYVGAGNYLNVLSGNSGFTATAIGTATSALSGVVGVGS